MIRLLVLVLSGLVGWGCARPEEQPAELPVVLYDNAVVHTVDDQWPRAEAIAVRRGRIAAVGQSKALRRKYKLGKVVDLEGACVVPGLIDAHGHLAALGALRRQVDLRGVESYDELVRAVKSYARGVPPEAWITGGRWDQANWGEKEMPTHEALSAATPHHYVLLSRVDGHAALANRNALSLAGITRDTPDPEGGEIVRGADGEPTGILVDNAVELVRVKIPQGGGLETEELWAIAQEACFALGLTSVHDAGVKREDLAALQRAYDVGILKLRVYAMLSDGRGMEEYLETHRPVRDTRLSVGALKLYVDGAMGSRGAWMLEPYSDRPGHVGLNVAPMPRIRRLCEVAARNGWQVCTHAIGDRANRETLDAYEAALRRHAADLRFRVEHAQCVSLADLPRFHELGVIASMQPTHATSDMRWAEERVGKERLQGCYAWRRLLNTGARLAFGSDFPVESENPLWGIYAAVTRQDHEGKPAGGWVPSQRLTREEALRLFTIDAAYAAFQEKQIGSLRPGKRADFVVFDRDILACPPAELLRAKVRMTVVEGQLVYEARRVPPPTRR